MRSKQLQILCKHTRQPFGIERRCLRSGSHDQRRENQNFQKMHQNLSEIPVWGVFGQNRILKMCNASNLQFWSTKPLPTRPMTTKVFETIHGAPTEPMAASQSMGTHLFSVRKNFKKSKITKIGKNLDYLGQQKIKVPIGPSLALECKCAFGAIKRCCCPIGP